MNLSPHFTLNELSFSELAARRGIINMPGQIQIANLQDLCETILEPARLILGVPFHINSGYRSNAINLAIGGATSSAHMDGRAADFVPVDLFLKDAFDLLRTSTLPFDQIIFECAAWIHIAIATSGSKPRREALTATGHAGAWHYEKVT